MNESTIKTAFVTGGSRGIGRGICEILAQGGYDVAFTYSSAEKEAEELAAYIKGLGRKCFYYQASLEKADVPTDVTNKAINDLGRLDVLVNNAGQTKLNKIPETTAEQIDFIYGLNFRNGILCSAVASKHMIDNGIKGNIIFITSSRGERAYPRDSIYGGLKAALKRAVESMALELAPHDIRVNCVAPGNTKVRGDVNKRSADSGWVKKIPLGRAGTPHEVGYLVEFLCSDKAEYITGVSVRIDGGLILPGMPEGDSPTPAGSPAGLSSQGWGIMHK